MKICKNSQQFLKLLLENYKKVDKNNGLIPIYSNDNFLGFANETQFNDIKNIINKDKNHDNLIHKLLLLSNLKQEDLQKQIHNIFSNYNSSLLYYLINNKNNKKFNPFIKNIKKYKPFNLKHNIIKLIPDCYKFDGQLIDDLWKLKGYSIGPGEICLALFSNCIKLNHGDLSVIIDNDIKKIELKKSTGRVGANSNYLPSALNRLYTNLRDKNINICDHIFDEISNKQKYLKNYNKIPTWIKFDRIYKKIYETKHISFSKFIKTLFLNKWKLTKRDTIKCLLLCLNYYLNEEDYYHLKAQIMKFFKKPNYTKFRTDEKFLKKIFLALHIYCYQLIEKFDYLIIFNDDKKAIILDFDGSFEYIFKQIETNQLTTTLHIGNNSQPGVDVIFK